MSENELPALKLVLILALAIGLNSCPAVAGGEAAAYLDSVWTRISRAFGTPDDIYPGTLAITFMVDRNGNASKITTVKPTNTAATDKALLDTISRAAPFPPLPSGLPDNVLVRCVMDVNGNFLRLGLSLPDLESKGNTKLTTMPDDSQGPSQDLKSLLDSLQSGGPQARHDALMSLRDMGPAASGGIPIITAAFRDKSEDVRKLSIEAVEAMGPAALPALKSLIEALNSPYAEDREMAAKAIGAIGPTAEEAVPALVEAIDDADSSVRDAAVTACRKLGPSCKKCIPAVLTQMRQYVGVSSLEGRLAEYGPIAVPALIEAMSDQQRNLREHSIETIAQMGEAARPAIAALSKALHDPEEEVTLRAAEAIRDLGPIAKDAVPDLLLALKDGNSSMRGRAVDALGAIGPDARAAVPALKQLLTDESLRREAKDAIRKIEAPL